MRKAFVVLIWITVTTLAYGQLPNSTMNGRVTDLQGATTAGGLFGSGDPGPFSSLRAFPFDLT
ncbi:MAG TPA: hypothetical protein VK798_03425 [Alloacidobacterium sp.]|jgi:hypothetical protein|nr:hypothetical protein [Alloacidobacterium sp.]